tara:strand:- start:457 stop:1536 length:1080 start_codon:yes stop_codon:yes gene_type:complete
MNQTSQGRRTHGYRGRRSPDKRGGRSSGNTAAARRKKIDIEQIMQDIRSRVSQQHGIDLNEQQVKELATRRLDAILDIKSANPALLEKIRRSVGKPVSVRLKQPPKPKLFQASTLYGSSNVLLRILRRLLKPILHLFLEPKALFEVLNLQVRGNAEAREREVEHVKKQAEWNALHYEILQRLVIEVSKLSLQEENLSLQIEALTAKVEFNERRVRTLEASLHEVSTDFINGSQKDKISGTTTEKNASIDPPRRRRRRRRSQRQTGANESNNTSAQATLSEPSTPTTDSESHNTVQEESPSEITALPDQKALDLESSDSVKQASPDLVVSKQEPSIASFSTPEPSESSEPSSDDSNQKPL